MSRWDGFFGGCLKNTNLPVIWNSMGPFKIEIWWFLYRFQQPIVND